MKLVSPPVRPNSFTYNALIDACAKAAEVDRAFEVRRCYSNLQSLALLLTTPC